MSVVFIIASTSIAARGAVMDSISRMAVGDHAAIIKFRTGRSADPGIPSPAFPVLQPFTAIDGDAGTNTLISFASNTSFLGSAFYLAAIRLAADQFETPPVTLPNGPKAIVLIGSVRAGRGTPGDAMAHANANGIPIFTVSTSDISADAAATALMTLLADDTGGHYFPARTDEEVTAASREPGCAAEQCLPARDSADRCDRL